MASKNDITGDKIQTKGMLSKEGEANWDLIFGNKSKESLNEKTTSSVHAQTKNYANTNDVNVSTVQDSKADTFSRIDTIGQNGNEGIHYEYELDKSNGEVIKINSKKLTDAFNGH